MERLRSYRVRTVGRSFLLRSTDFLWFPQQRLIFERGPAGIWFKWLYFSDLGIGAKAREAVLAALRWPSNCLTNGAVALRKWEFCGGSLLRARFGLSEDETIK
jgi:hypothetical protein